jgi:demethylmenaquinone methyltransferase/2-methoxy-6-polyprenyl-1,4-benzoquinol methylase
VTGTTPPGITEERAASQWVREMFGRVARRYDLLNHLLSFNLDKRWRARAVERVRPILEMPGARVLDLCCGTGDLLLALAAKLDINKLDIKAPGAAAILGSDFCHPMLIQAKRKIGARQPASRLFEADALALPLRDNSLDLVTVAFGFRNLANYEKGLEELLRVLKPGGVAAILEFSQPTNRAFAELYVFFSGRVLPWLGGLLSGYRDAYAYLPESIRKFPGAEDLASAMRRSGFTRVEFERMTGGAVALHLARK